MTENVLFDAPIPKRVLFCGFVKYLFETNWFCNVSQGLTVQLHAFRKIKWGKKPFIHPPVSCLPELTSGQPKKSHTKDESFSLCNQKILKLLDWSSSNICMYVIMKFGSIFITLFWYYEAVHHFKTPKLQILTFELTWIYQISLNIFVRSELGEWMV